MARLTAETPLLHPECEITNARFGRYVEIGRGSRVLNSEIGDYSYCDRYADIANATVGKFANIASFTRIGPTDHPMGNASLHHFLYRSDD
ncbi:chloramphenicol acetyltransferase, partial [Thioclava sp. BHET1]